VAANVERVTKMNSHGTKRHPKRNWVKQHIGVVVAVAGINVKNWMT